MNEPPLHDNKLEVEDVDARLERLQTTLAKLNARTDDNGKEVKISTAPPDFSFLHRSQATSRPCYVPPPTKLLSRIQAFLPALEAANASLQPGSADIVSEQGEGMYVEMDLGLGVYSTAPSTSSAYAFPPSIPIHKLPNRSSSSSSTSSSASSSSSLSSSSASCTVSQDESDSDDNAEIINTSFKPIRPIKPLPRRMRVQQPRIIVLGDCGGTGARGIGTDDASGG